MFSQLQKPCLDIQDWQLLLKLVMLTYTWPGKLTPQLPRSSFRHLQSLKMSSRESTPTSFDKKALYVFQSKMTLLERCGRRFWIVVHFLLVASSSSSVKNLIRSCKFLCMHKVYVREVFITILSFLVYTYIKVELYFLCWFRKVGLFCYFFPFLLWSL